MEKAEAKQEDFDKKMQARSVKKAYEYLFDFFYFCPWMSNKKTMGLIWISNLAFILLLESTQIINFVMNYW